MVEEYKDGGGCADIAVAHGHTPSIFARFLRSIGIYRNKSQAQRVRYRRETHTISDAPWVASELDAITHAPSIGLRNFKPMLTVSVADGVLQNRMAEALEAFDVFEVTRHAS